MKFNVNTLVLSVPVLLWVIIRWCLDFNGLYGQDAHEYYRFTNELYGFFTGGEAPGAFFWPINYPVLGGLLKFIFRDSAIALQLLSVAAFTGVLFYVRKLVHLLFHQSDRQLDIYLLIFLLLSPYMLRSGMLVMSDMTAAFFIVAGTFHLVRYGDTVSRKDFMMGALFAGLAAMTRYASLVVIAIPAVYALWHALRNRDWLMPLGGITAAAIGFVPHILYRSETLFDWVNHYAIQYWSVGNFFRTTFDTTDGKVIYDSPNIVYALEHFYHPGFLFAGLIFLVFTKRSYLFRRRSLMVVIPVIAYTLFLAGVNYQNPRFLILTFPFVVVLMYPAYQKASGYLSTWMRKSALVGAVAIQLVLIGYVSLPHYQTNQLEQDASRMLAERTESKVYTFWLDAALKNYEVPQEVINLWEKDITTYEPDQLVLFNEAKFAYQWEGRNPMTNWQRLKTNYSLQKVDSLAGGWELFKIQVR